MSEGEGEGDHESKRRKLTRNEKKRLRKKLEKRKESVLKASEAQNRPQILPLFYKQPYKQNSNLNGQHLVSQLSKDGGVNSDLGVVVEYVPQDLTFIENGDVSLSSAEAKYFKDVFKKFAEKENNLYNPSKVKSEDSDNEDQGESDGKAAELALQVKLKIEEELKAKNEENAKKEGEQKLSRKARKRLKAESVSLLKEEVERADLVESQDVNSRDPKFLLYLKAHKNTVAVPKHWSAKYRYLQHKPWNAVRYKLPDFINEAGVYKIRDSADDTVKKAKQIARERTRPRLGRLDLDYQKLHDAFFKHQQQFYLPSLKRHLCSHGEMYYETLDLEARARHKKYLVSNAVATLTPKIRQALGIENELLPPPWLINMQRYGPPRSYPSLKIPGLNFPIPKGTSFGLKRPGIEWGKPPVDNFNRPFYGYEVFMDIDTLSAQLNLSNQKTPLWGEFAHTGPTDDESEEDEEEEFDEGEEVKVKIMDQNQLEEATERADEVALAKEQQRLENIQEAAAEEQEMEMVEDRELDLRKESENALQSGHAKASQRKELYRVLEQKPVKIDTKALHASSYVYDVNGNKKAVKEEEANDEEEEEIDLSSVLAKDDSKPKDKSQKVDNSYENFKF